ncbi:FMR1 neighbor protein [Sagmatias obliquidens]|uniref:FMR1 neighbor protein n=1 Tax=Sagmatias obliquidens TaxID=3371155 RepID=UPI000F441FB6|nr:fragile X mental retardation 1 neighbor protein [Lagenorhynchus obliquidens]
MPSKGQLSRGRRRPKTRALRAARRKQSSCQAGSQEKNTEMVSSTSGSAPEDQAIMADRPKPGPRAFLCGIQACYSLVKVWACKHSRLLLFGVCALLMLLFYCYLSARFSNSVSPTENILWSNENVNGQPLEETAAWEPLEETAAGETLLSFFFPTTCIVQENQEIKPCRHLQDLSKSECLRYKCCYSSSKTSKFNCFAPLRDKPMQMFRMFGLGVISILILGCLPICCYLLCQRSIWANPLRRKVNRILKGFKNRRRKPKRVAGTLGKATDEEGLGDEKEQETTAFLPEKRGSVQKLASSEAVLAYETQGDDLKGMKGGR